MPIPKPSEVSELQAIAPHLDEATHEERVSWVRSLNGTEQFRLYDLAKGNPLGVDDLVRGEGEVVIHYGRNGLSGPFNLFQKRLTLLGSEHAGYNHDEFPALLAPLARLVTGPGHFLAYDSPEVPGEVWIDYRRIPTRQHPDFPPLVDNEGGLRALVFGNMVDIVRRVSKHVFIGDSTKAFPREGRTPLLVRIGSKLPTAPFVVCQAP